MNKQNLESQLQDHKDKKRRILDQVELMNKKVEILDLKIGQIERELKSSGTK